jgi:DmsE family decaheme c-type cytochrome
VQCVDCHNPHGTATVRQLRSLPGGDAVCYKCHVDKQGPFIYEHAPVKTEGCSSCHTPHGSTNPRLLKVMPVNTLCLQCHTFSSQFTAGGPIGPAHNQSAKYQACTIDCGFGSIQSLRRSFLRVLHVPPNDYRHRFTDLTTS